MAVEVAAMTVGLGSGVIRVGNVPVESKDVGGTSLDNRAFRPWNEEPLALVRCAPKTQEHLVSVKVRVETDITRSDPSQPAPELTASVSRPLQANISDSTTSSVVRTSNSASPAPSTNSSRSRNNTTPTPRSGPFKSRHRPPRNYKNMTRERRIEANARERTRVHTISAAFETLRRSVPSYSHNQKLSKLSVLRVAASYILTLSRILGKDYSADGSEPSIEDCVQNVSNTIQMEGKLRKKRDE